MCATLISKALRLARVNEGSHSATRHPPTHLSTRKMNHPAFTPQPQSITALWSILISRPAEGRMLSWPGWLGETLRWFARSKTVTHPSISCGRRESNSRPSNRKSNTLTIIVPNHEVCDKKVVTKHGQETKILRLVYENREVGNSYYRTDDVCGRVHCRCAESPNSRLMQVRERRGNTRGWTTAIYKRAPRTADRGSLPGRRAVALDALLGRWRSRRRRRCREKRLGS